MTHLVTFAADGSTSTVSLNHRSCRFSVSLSTDNDAVTFDVVAVVVDGTETRTETVTMPEPRMVSGAVCEHVAEVIDHWFRECPWENAPLTLVRELLRIRKEFYGVYIESL